MKILGISAYYHDSAAALVNDGNIIAAAQEERFSRKKHDPDFPANAIKFCLEKGNTDIGGIDFVVFYDKPFITFERLLETYLTYAPKGLKSFLKSMPVWLKEKLFLKNTIKKELMTLSGLKQKELPVLMFTEHHQAHAASAFFPSPFDNAAVLCMDGVGEWATSSIWVGEANRLEPVSQLSFPHSLGLLYSTFTYYTGFKVNSGEYKLMGLAPYGDPVYVDKIYDHLIDCKNDGSFRLNMKYFNYASGLTMTGGKFHKLFGGGPRKPESEITQKEMDIARSIQVVTEEVIIRTARHIKSVTGADYLCLAGGVALNCVANGKIFKEKIFKDVWIQPAAGDAGGAIGAALSIWYEYLENERQVSDNSDACYGSFLGPEFTNSEIEAYLKSVNAVYAKMDDEELIPEVARKISQENVIGWFSGRMEFGPRALGARSITGDPRSKKMQSVMNLKIKFRESFRPFAPAVKAEKVSDWFNHEGKSPYMLVVANIKEDKQCESHNLGKTARGFERLAITRSVIPAVTHVDSSARIQTVHKETNPRFWKLIDSFDRLTGCPVLINTSFNVRGEPIVCSPKDAYRCFMRTEMDHLVIENFLLDKKKQPAGKLDNDWQQEYELD